MLNQSEQQENKILRLLLIDDEPNDRKLIERRLEKYFEKIKLIQPRDYEEFERLIARIESLDIDIVITDYRFRWSDGIELLRKVKSINPEIPVIMFTATGNEEIAVEAMKAGLDDYVLKRHITRLPETVNKLIEKRKRERESKKILEIYKRVFYNVPIGLYRLNGDGKLIEVNNAFRRILGIPESFPFNEIDTASFYLNPADRERFHSVIQKNDFVHAFEVRLKTYDNRIIWASLNERAVRDESGKIVFYEGSIEDITERKRAQEELKNLTNILDAWLKRRNEEIDIMYELSLDWGYQDTFSELFEVIIEKVSKVIDFDIACYRINYEDSREARIYAKADLDDKTKQLIKDKLLKKDYNRSDTPHTDVKFCRIKNGKEELKGKLHSFLEFPIKISDSDEVLGIILVGSEKDNAFSEDDKRFLKTIITHSAYALERLHGKHLKEKERLEEIIQNLPDAILVLNSSKNVLVMNQRAREILDILKPDVRNEQIHLSNLMGIDIEKLILSFGGSGKWEEIVTTVNSERRVFKVAGKILPHGGPDLHYLLVIRDVTVEREFRTKMETQNRLATVGQLAAGIAHDFNNILTPIYGYATLYIEKNEVEKSLKDVFKIIANQAERATNLVKQILDYSRKSIVRKKLIDLGVFLKDSVGILRRTIPENIKINLTIRGEKFFVEADETGLHQILTNLAVNSRDAMPAGGKINIVLFKKELTEVEPGPFPEMPIGEYAIIEFSDTGIGIKEDIIHRIFDPFFTTKKPGKGTGLGLSQVYGIMKQFNGYIDVRSAPGEGTTFVMYFPIKNIDRRDEAEESATMAPYDGRKRTVLVVEDDTEVRSVLKLMLERMNFKVLTASSGYEGMKTLMDSNYRIDLLITDLVMPGMGGEELLREIKKIERDIRVIVISGYPLKIEELPEGVDNFMIKPISMETLAQTLEEVLFHR